MKGDPDLLRGFETGSELEPAPEASWSVARPRIDYLARELRYHAEKYFRHDRPEESDQQWDAMLEELARLEMEFSELRRPDSPTRMVGWLDRREANQAEHAPRMLSLHAVHMLGDLERFDERIRSALGVERVQYSVEPKLDGVALDVLYRDGSFVRALTRGDGRKGVDVSDSIRASGAVPLALRGFYQGLDLQVRGELVIPREAYAELCRTIHGCGIEPYASARHAVSAALRQQDRRLTGLRGLCFYPWQLVAGGLGLLLQSDRVKALGESGLQMPCGVFQNHGIDEAMACCARLVPALDDWPVEVDGLVVKVDRLDWQEVLGAGERTPNWAVAYKPIRAHGEGA